MKSINFCMDKKMFTKIICILIAAVLFLSACGNNGKKPNKDKDKNNSSQSSEVSSDTTDNQSEDSSTDSDFEIENDNQDDNFDFDFDFDIEYGDGYELEEIDYSVNKSFVTGAYKKVWGDDFTTGKIDRNKWDILESTDKDTIWSADEDVLNAKDGHLNMITRHYFDPYDSVPQYKLPAEVNTLKTMNFKYGYLEMCAKVPFKGGAWPSFWMRGVNGPGSKGKNDLLDNVKVNMDYLTEVDIFENFGTVDSLKPNIHKWYDGGRNKNMTEILSQKGEDPTYTFSSLARLSEEYHVYGFEWTSEKMVMYIDGESYYTYDITDKANFDHDDFKTDMSGFHDPHYILFWNNIHTPLRQDSNLVNPADLPLTYAIDWINLYQIPGKGELYIKETK